MLVTQSDIKEFLSDQRLLGRTREETCEATNIVNPNVYKGMTLVPTPDEEL